MRIVSDITIQSYSLDTKNGKKQQRAIKSDGGHSFIEKDILLCFPRSSKNKSSLIGMNRHWQSQRWARCVCVLRLFPSDNNRFRYDTIHTNLRESTDSKTWDTMNGIDQEGEANSRNRPVSLSLSRRRKSDKQHNTIVHDLHLKWFDGHVDGFSDSWTVFEICTRWNEKGPRDDNYKTRRTIRFRQIMGEVGQTLKSWLV